MCLSAPPSFSLGVSPAAGVGFNPWRGWDGLGKKGPVKPCQGLFCVNAAARHLLRGLFYLPPLLPAAARGGLLY